MKFGAMVALLIAPALLAQDRRFTPAEGGRRLALVIGNAAYSSIERLANPVNDARAVAATLKTVGFADRDVRLVVDAPREPLRRSVREFVESVKAGDLAFVYYAGHGVEVKGSNFLLPIDVPRDASEGYVEDEAVSAQRLLRDLDNQGARVRVLILDACRDNPLRASRSVGGGGLAPMEGKGSLVVFSTEAGRTAADTPGRSNSVFTEQLLQGLRQPGVSLDDAMKRVSRNVARATNERQIPAIYGLLLDDVILVPGVAAAPVSRDRTGQAMAAMNPKDGLIYVHVPMPKRPFWMGQTEVTQAAYLLVTGSNPSSHSGPRLPVEQVTYEEAQKYCKAIGGRLPTNEEWEVAAQGGNAVGILDSTAWYAGNSGQQTHEVGTKNPIRFGLQDMFGNVWEWVDDGKAGPSHLLRGGSVINTAPMATEAHSDPAVPKTGVVGFRCVQD